MKKQMKRYLSFVMAAIMLLSTLFALPLQIFAADSTTMRYGKETVSLNLIEGYDTPTSGTVTFDAVGFETGVWGGYSIAGGTATLNVTTWMYYNDFNDYAPHTSDTLTGADYSDVTYFVVDIKSLCSIDTNFSMDIDLDSGVTSAINMTLVENNPVYLIDRFGNRTVASGWNYQENLKRNCFTLPANFTGYIAIPAALYGFTGENSVNGLRYFVGPCGQTGSVCEVYAVYTCGELPSYEADTRTIKVGTSDLTLTLVDNFESETYVANSQWGIGTPRDGGIVLTTQSGSTISAANGFASDKHIKTSFANYSYFAFSLKNLVNYDIYWHFEPTLTSGSMLHISSTLAADYPIYLVDGIGNTTKATLLTFGSWDRACILIPRDFDGMVLIPKGVMATSASAAAGAFGAQSCIQNLGFFALGNSGSTDLVMVDDFYVCGDFGTGSTMPYDNTKVPLTLVDSLDSVSMSTVGGDTANHGTQTFSGGRWLFEASHYDIGTSWTNEFAIQNYTCTANTRYIIVSLQNAGASTVYFGFTFNNKAIKIPTAYMYAPMQLVSTNGTHTYVADGTTDFTSSFAMFPVPAGFNGYMVVPVSAFSGYTSDAVLQSMTMTAYRGQQNSNAMNFYVDNVFTAAALPGEKAIPTVDMLTYTANPGTVVANGQPVTVDVALKDSVMGAGQPHITYRDAAGYAVSAPRKDGTYSVYASMDAGSSFTAMPETLLYTFTITCDHAIGDSNNDGRCDNCSRNLSASWVASSVSMGGDIGVNFYFEMTDAVANDPSTAVTFTLPGGRSQTMLLSEAVNKNYNGTNCYVFSVHLAAKQMTDNIQAQVITSAGSGTTVTYSVKQYAEGVRNLAGIDDYSKNVATTLLNYGAAAQAKFDYKTDDLANADLPASVQYTGAPDPAGYNLFNQCNGSVNGLTYLGTTMVFESTVAIRFYFSVATGSSINDYTFKVGSTTLTPVAVEDRYCVELADIAVRDLDQLQTLVVNDGAMTVEYSGDAYVNSILNGSYDDNMKTLAKAVYAYGQASQIYLATADEKEMVRLVAPFWEGNRVYRESVAFHERDDGTITAKLQYTAKKIISIEDCYLQKTYVEGVDYVWNTGTNTLTWLTNSSIPYFFKGELNGNDLAGNRVDGLTVYGNAIFNNGPIIYEKQVAVTYEHDGARSYTTSAYQGEKYAHVLEKMRRGEKVNIYVYGDSISWGCDSSASVNREPFQDNWGQLVGQYLRYRFSNENINVITDSSLPGATSTWGKENVFTTPESHTPIPSDPNDPNAPDLVIVSWGMNDSQMDTSVNNGAGYTAALTASNMQSVVEQIKGVHTNCEFLLIAPIAIGEDVGWRGITNNDEYPTVFKEVADAKGCAFADMYNIHMQMIANGDFASYTGNNINHPNDFLIRVYAAQVLKTMFKAV